MKQIGWIGLGNMGNPMASNLVKAGFPLTVFNRSTEKTKPFENTNVKIAQNVTELVTQSDIIFTMLSNDEAVGMVYDEILGMETIEGKLFIDMSTISEQLSVSIAQKLKKKRFLSRCSRSRKHATRSQWSFDNNGWRRCK